MRPLILLGLALGVYAFVAALFEKNVPGAYMDEIFHVPQTQRYCSGDWSSWDPMITTFPGLYCTAVLYSSILSLTSSSLSLPSLCSLPLLRSLNIILSLLSIILAYFIARQLDPHPKDTTQAITKAALVGLYPVHFFFAFLFYTDVGSLALVLGLYLCQLCGRYWLSALIGCGAVLFRQTNAVWVAFTLSEASLTILNGIHAHATSATHTNESPNKDKETPSTCLEDQGLVVLASSGWAHRGRVVWEVGPLMGVCAAFALFVLKNGGVVVGAKEAHMPSLHLVQPLYFAAVTAGAFWPLLLTSPELAQMQGWATLQLRTRPWQSLLTIIAGVGIALLCVHKCSLAHPYLLSDNRHYTFYIWKDVIQGHWGSKYLLLPLYLFSTFLLFWHLGKRRSLIWRVLFAGATFAVLVPAQLIELRYFTTPLVLILLNIRIPQGIPALMVLGAFVVINCFVCYMFLYRPFLWPSSSDLQRFMW